MSKLAKETKKTKKPFNIHRAVIDIIRENGYPMVYEDLTEEQIDHIGIETRRRVVLRQA